MTENEKDWWRIYFTFHFPLQFFSLLEKWSNLYDLDCFWLYLSVAKVRIEKFLLTKKLWPKNCDWVPHWPRLELVVFYCKISMPLRAMRIPQRTFDLKWGKNITRALSKKARVPLSYDKNWESYKLFKKSTFFWNTLTSNDLPKFSPRATSLFLLSRPVLFIDLL